MIILDDLTLMAQVAAQPAHFLVMRDKGSRVIGLCMHAGCYAKWMEDDWAMTQFWRSLDDMTTACMEVSLMPTAPYDVTSYASFGDDSGKLCTCTRCKQVEYHGPPAPQR